MRATLALSFVLVAPVALAQQGDRDRARTAYEEGTKAFKKGDFEAAATKYAEADSIAPSPVALQAALDAAVKADDAVLGAELLERARTRDVKGALATSVQTATTKLAHRAGKVTATCPSACTVTLDGSAIEAGRARWVKPGTHAVVFTIGGQNETKSVDVAADAEVSVQAPAPPPPTPPSNPITTTVETPPPPPPQALFNEPYIPPVHKKSGVSPALFWASLGGTVAFTAASVTLLAVTKSTHDDFLAQSCALNATASCKSLASQGNTTMILGDTFLGVSIAAAIWTVIAGAVVVKWKPDIDVAAQAHGATVFWRLAF